MSIPRLSEDDIKEMALKIAQRKLYVGAQVPIDLWPSVFIPLAFGLPDSSIEELGMIVADFDKRGHWAVNGYPTFLEAKLVHKDDWPLVFDKAQAVEKAMKAAL